MDGVRPVSAYRASNENGSAQGGAVQETPSICSLG